jgi:hypothetical protein
MTHTAHPHGARRSPTAAPTPALPDLGPGWDWLTITIPINHANLDIEQIAHEAADAARAALTHPA